MAYDYAIKLHWKRGGKIKKAVKELIKSILNTFYRLLSLASDNRKKRKIREIIKKCSPIEQRILALYYYEGCSIAEIAQVLNVDDGQIVSSLLLLMRKIKEEIKWKR